MSTKKPSGWWNAAAFHQPLLSLSPTKNVNYTYETGKSDKKHRFQPDIVKRYKRGIDYLKQARNIEELFLLPSLHYEVLKGDKAGVSSIRVNDQYRIEFTVEQVSEPIIVTICNIIELSNHYK